MSLEKAIHDLEEIRTRLRAVEAIRSFRCVTIYFSALFFVLASQLMRFYEVHIQNGFQFAKFWAAVTFVCLLAIGIELAIRSLSPSSRITLNWTRAVAISLLPAIAAALLVTLAVSGSDEMSILLPGLWGVFGGLALTGCHNLLPRRCQWASFCLMSLGVLALFQCDWVLANPGRTMSGIFGSGLFVLAVTLQIGAGRGESDAW